MGSIGTAADRIQVAPLEPKMQIPAIRSKPSWPTFHMQHSMLTALLARGMGQARAIAGATPPSSLVLLSILAVQMGAVLAKHLFAVLDPMSAASVRVGLAALLLFATCRPRLGGQRWQDYLQVVGLGLSMACMNLAFYGAIARIPLGVAVSLEFVGPLGVAIAGSRKSFDLIWVTLAVMGVVLLTPLTHGELDQLGLALAVIAGGCWAAYILLAGPVGRSFTGRDGLALAMAVAALALLPLGVLQQGVALLQPAVFILGFGTALLGSAVPYTLEFQALKRLPPRIFGILISIEPAVAALIGFILLGEQLAVRTLIAIALITTAAIGVTLFGNRNAAH